MSIEYAIKTRMNKFDVYDEKYKLVHFYATEENKQLQRSTITLIIGDGYIQIGGSMVLPTNGWREHAAAVKRAEEFLTVSGLSDSRP